MNNSENKDYYEILGVDRNATKDEIKKSYKKLVLQFHPDRNPENREEADEKIREITEAYSVLSDDEKKEMYDKFGTVDYDGSPDININEIFSQMGINIPGMFSGRMNNPENNYQKHIVNLTGKELYEGTIKNVSIKINEKCDQCEGTGTKDKSDSECKQCGGDGIEIINHMPNPGIPMIQRIQKECSKCEGKGIFIDKGKKCEKCEGNCTIEGKCDKEIKIKENFDYKTKMRLKGSGDFNPKLNKNKDIIIEFKINLEGTNFSLVTEYDLLYHQEITIKDSLTGYILTFDHIDGKKYYVEFDKVIKDDSDKLIFNCGLPNDDDMTKLFVKFKIIYPEKTLTNEEYDKFINKSQKIKKEKLVEYIRRDFIDIEEYKKQKEREKNNSHGFTGGNFEQNGECTIC